MIKLLHPIPLPLLFYFLLLCFFFCFEIKENCFWNLFIYLFLIQFGFPPISVIFSTKFIFVINFDFRYPQMAGRLREMRCELSFLKNADGSACFSQGATCIWASCSGPGDVHASKASDEAMTLDISYRANCGDNKFNVVGVFVEITFGIILFSAEQYHSFYSIQCNQSRIVSPHNNFCHSTWNSGWWKYGSCSDKWSLFCSTWQWNAIRVSFFRYCFKTVI